MAGTSDIRYSFCISALRSADGFWISGTLGLGHEGDIHCVQTRRTKHDHLLCEYDIFLQCFF